MINELFLIEWMFYLFNVYLCVGAVNHIMYEIPAGLIKFH